MGDTYMALEVRDTRDFDGALSPNGIALVHRVPPVGLKCVSDRRRSELAALVGGARHRLRLLGRGDHVHVLP